MRLLSAAQRVAHDQAFIVLTLQDWQSLADRLTAAAIEMKAFADLEQLFRR